MTEQDKYAQVLADLERRRDEINQAIATIRAISNMPPESPSALEGALPDVPRTNGAGVLRPHMFFGMKAPEAIKGYLSAVKETRTAAKIASDLLEYGWNTTSNNPANIIRTALVRLAESDEVVQVKGKEWGLVSWFPGLNKGKRGSGSDETEKSTHQSEYHNFLSEKMSEGMSMKEAAKAWQEHKQRNN